MAGEPSRKAFGEYQGQKVNPIPEGFLAAYANVAKNIESTGESIGKGLEGIMVKYAQAEENRNKLTNALKNAAPDAQTAVSYYHSLAKENMSTIPSFDDMNSEMSDGKDFDSNIQFRLSAAENYASSAKEIEQYITSPDKHSNDDMIRILGLIQAGKANAAEAAETQAKQTAAALTGAVQRSTIAVNESKVASANAAQAKANSETQTSVVATVYDEVAKGTKAIESARSGQTPEQAKAEYNRLENLLKQRIQEHQQSLRNGGPPVLTDSDVALFTKEMAGLDAYIKAVDPTVIEEWKKTYGPAVIRSRVETGHIEDVAKMNATLDAMKKSLDSPTSSLGISQMGVGMSSPSAVDSIFPKIDSSAYADFNAKIQAAKDDIAYHIRWNPNTELYLGSDFGTEGDRFYTQVQERRAMAQTVARIQQTYATTDWQGKPVLGAIQPHELEQIQKVVKLGGLGMMDTEGRRWKIEKDGRLSYEMDAKFSDIMKKNPDLRTAEELKYVNQTHINNGKIDADLKSSNFGFSRVVTVETPNGTIKQLQPVQYTQVMAVPDHPELSIYVSGQANVDPQGRGKRLNEFATSNKTINEAQDIINQMVRLDQFGKPDPDPTTGEIQALSATELTDDKRRELALRYYQLIKAYAQGLGVRLTDTHYRLVSGMMGIPVDAFTSNVDKKFFGVVITEQMRKEMLPPSEMVKLLQSAQHEIHDEAFNKINNGIDFYAIDKDGNRIGNLALSKGLGNHVTGGIGIDGKPAKSGDPVVKPALIITRRLVASGKPPTPEELKVLRASYQEINNIIIGQIKSTNNPEEINDIGATWTIWTSAMEKDKAAPTKDTPERTAFIDACTRQGMTLEAVKWWINSSTNKQITAQ